MARPLTVLFPPTLVARLVETHMGGPFIWRLADCCSGPARIFADLTGVDVLRDLRASYPERGQVVAEMRKAGGALDYAGARLADAGLVPVPEQPGALGIAATPRGFHGAVCLMPGAWAIKAKEGFTVVKSVDAIWGLTAWRPSAEGVPA